MSLELIVLARPDGPYCATIQESIQIANDLQTHFRFKLENALWLPKESGRHTHLADKAFRSEIQDQDDRTPLIVVTSIPLYGGNFAFEYRDRSVISLHDWEDNFAPPPVKVYLIYQLAYIATIVAADLTDSRIDKMQHPPKGCLFDETEGADEFRVSLVGAHLCAACEGKLAEMMIPAEALEAINQVLGYVRSATIRKVRPLATKIFIGHGRASDWKSLATFLHEDLHCEVVEFNSDPTAGLFTGERILEMLERSRFAFLVMTAEDEQANGTFQARQNVIHEVGLCQGRLGFHRAIAVKEDMASTFSNMAGLTYIEFRRGALSEAFPEIARTLVREGLVDSLVSERVLRKLNPAKPAA
jgi:Predicted nucleotide-binding protein containing TIR-like domain